MARDVYWCQCMWAWSAILAVLFPLAAGGGIKVEPRITERWVTPKVVREGDFVKLMCPITSSPDPIFGWYKGNEEVKATWQRYNTRKHTLKIKMAQISDSGAYTCVGVNGFGQANASMHLIVLGKNEPPGNVSAPMLTKVWPEGLQQRRIGESLTLTCMAVGLPTPTVSWHKDGLMLGKEGEHLTFNGVQSTDSGLYTCKASSSLGAKTANFSVNVVEATKEQELEISEAVNTTVAEGRSTSLQCTVRTSYEPKVQWLKEISSDSTEGGKINNTPFEQDDRSFRKVEGAGAVVSRGDGTYLSKLTIANATQSDAGVYVCLGVNTHGFSFREAHLTVIRLEGDKRDPPVGPKEKNINWFFLIIPAVVILVVVVVAVMCQMRKTGPDKPMGVSPPTPVLKGDDTSALAPLNPDSHGHLPRPPDLVYQEVSGYPGSNLRSTHTNSFKDQYPSPYPESYPESYPEPAYSDPYSGERGPTRASEHSYARLTHPSHPSHPSLASHPSHTSHASSSPHLPPPYAHTHVHGHAHTHAHTHRHPQYFVHYNL